MQTNSVNEGIFRFLGARIWTPMPVYRYENPSGYVTDILVSETITVKNTGGAGFRNNRKNRITKNCTPFSDCVS